MIRLMLFPLFAMLLLAAPASAAEPARPLPLRPAEAPARGGQLATMFAAICRAPDRGVAAMAARAAALGFTPRPDDRREFTDTTGWRTLHEEWALHPGGDESQPPLLFVWLDEERRPTGELFDWKCEVKLPASAWAPPRREVDAVFKALDPVLAGPAWRPKAAETPIGVFHVAERDMEGRRETYTAGFGLHTLVSKPTPQPAVLTVPR